MPTLPIRTFTVVPRLPDRLGALHTIAYNMWWCWHPDAIALFRRIDADAFSALGHSPIRLLAAVPQDRLTELAADDTFLAHMDRVAVALDAYLLGRTWYSENAETQRLHVAYFSMEFGIDESIPTYSGGLGVLAGDHLKSASDLGVPLVGVGLMYREGYFRQYLNADGWQQETYPENDFFDLPLVPEKAADGSALQIVVPLPSRDVHVRVWRIQVGRVPLYLLDTNLAENSADDRAITARLYGGDADMRIRQEIVLGIGGLRALAALGITPTVCHMNEGHSAFCGLERIRMLMSERDVDFATALEAVRAGTCFTTHTPVPAGNDVFSPQMIEQYLGWYLGAMNVDRRTFMGLGRQHPDDESENFGMTVLAIKLSNTTNGVSKLHGTVSQRMWRGMFPKLTDDEVPISAITNGVHTQTWLAAEMSLLYDRYVGVRWEDRPMDVSVWSRVDRIPDMELWRTHERRRERLVVFARERLIAQLRRRNAPQSQIARAEEALDPEALTIGFARRFATYKRGDLVFRDLDRLMKLVNDKERPVQFVFAGKAHPRDTEGKQIIARIAQFARRPELQQRVVFIEDYDMDVARTMYQGVDVWLNNPRRPLEASGTSGMKVATNGGLNFSVLDGWWVEGYTGDDGWSIGSGEEYTDLQYQDEVESRALYDVIEQEIVPAFYSRGSDQIPRGWLQRMKRSIATIVPVFNTHRMVAEYLDRCYRPASRRFDDLVADNMRGAIDLAEWRARMNAAWNSVRVETVQTGAADPLPVGADLDVRAEIVFGEAIGPGDVEVQVVHGALNALGDFVDPATVVLATDAGTGNGRVSYAGRVACTSSGRYGYAVRVLPRHRDLGNPLETGLVTWG